MEIVFQYLDELAETKETASAQVERNRIGYVLGKKSNHPDFYLKFGKYTGVFNAQSVQ